MSSTYRALCLSHDPALVLMCHEWSTSRALDAIAAAMDPASTPGLAEHRSCDLLIGRYSYPLIEVCCVGKPRCATVHRPEWIDARWLRLLHAAMVAPVTPTMTAAIGSVPRCWSEQRVMRLRDELGVMEPDSGAVDLSAVAQ